MSLPDINFENIRPVDGNRHAGFEEMCCQLASLEAASSGANFYRKGYGGDAGVECYVRRADGTEVGWQAKYLFQWSDSLKTKLDISIRTALKKHPPTRGVHRLPSVRSFRFPGWQTQDLTREVGRLVRAMERVRRIAEA